ncbi:MAG: YrbL family protein [Alphaproteobacteria bacterium]|nr:YrbL family protein [Alphaproteobacteria bacterium]
MKLTETMATVARASDKERSAPGEHPGAPVLDLEQAAWLGRGWKRDCLVHPEDPNLCIKVPAADPHESSSWRDRLTVWRHGEKSGEHHNRREWQAYETHGEILAPFIPRYHGLIETSRGTALVIDTVRNRDGSPAVQLTEWLKTGTPERGRALLARFEALFDVLLRHDIWLMDLNLRNFLIETCADGSERPLLVDLKRLADNKEILQLSGWSVALKRRKLKRRIATFKEKFRTRLGKSS